MNWEWRNRQSKFIGNEVYFSWWNGWGLEFPFWDERVLRFFQKLPYDLLYNRKFQRFYTQHYINSRIQGIESAIALAPAKKYTYLKAFLKHIPLVKLLGSSLLFWQSDPIGFVRMNGALGWIAKRLRYGNNYSANTDLAMLYSKMAEKYALGQIKI